MPVCHPITLSCLTSYHLVAVVPLSMCYPPGDTACDTAVGVYGVTWGSITWEDRGVQNGGRAVGVM